jgi:hypothetical protein
MYLALYLSLLIGGIVFLIAGLYLTRMTWRTDIEPYGRRSFLFQIAMHPERFATADRLGAIRVLNLTGAILLLGALMVVGYDIFSATTRR